MSLSPEQKQIKKDEAKIGRRAATAAQRYVQSNIKSKLHSRGIGSPYKKNKKEAKSILDATKVSSKMGSHRLLGMQFTSNRAGFVNHFGTKARTEHLVELSNHTIFQRSQHRFNLQSKSIFDDLYSRSGALDILEKGLSQTRTKAITIQLQNLAVEISNTNG